MDDLKGKQQLYNGFGDTLARGFEIAVTPFLVAAIGYGLDRLLGILPVCTIVFAIIGVVGVGVHTYYNYDAQMRVHDAEGPWARRDRRSRP